MILIIPPSPFLLDEKVFMSLGVLKVASVLEKKMPVKVLDLSGVKNYLEVIRNEKETQKAEVLGITATTPQMPAAFKIRQALGGRVILGGPHVTLVNAAYKKNPLGRARTAFEQLDGFDVLVAGDGEEAVSEALKEDSPHLVDGDDPKTRLFLDNQRLNELPYPARHLMDVSSYHYSIDGERALSLIAQLGCPFECGFCGGRLSPMLRRVRTRTSENVVNEMTKIYEDYGIKGFMMYDDELNVNPRMNELMELISKKSVNWKLRGFIKSQLFTEEQAARMVKAGFKWILVGFESGSPKILKNIKKRATREENSRCLQIAHKYGLKVKALMSLGHPGESLQTVLETKEWLLKERPDDFDITIITTYPGTPYYDQAVKQGNYWEFTANGDKLYSEEVDYTTTSDYYKGIPGEYKAYVFTDHLTSQELVKLRDLTEDEVRSTLGLPYPSKGYDHSMGQAAAV